MKYLSTILETNGIDEQHREAATASYLAAKERMKQLPVKFSDDAEMMLSNHLMALIKRISENKFIDPALYFAQNIKQDLEKNNLLNNKFEYEEFYVSSNPENFKTASELFYKLKQLPKLKAV